MQKSVIKWVKVVEYVANINIFVSIELTISNNRCRSSQVNLNVKWMLKAG